MADIVDMASDLEEQRRADLIAASHRAIGDPSATPQRRFCFDCADEIPEARLKAIPNAMRCAWCQTNQEKKTRVGA